MFVHNVIKTLKISLNTDLCPLVDSSRLKVDSL